MFGVPDQIPSQPAGLRVSQSESRAHLGFRVTDPSQPAAELDPLLVRAMPFSPPNVSASWPSGAFHYHKEVGVRGAGAGRQLLPPCWTRSTPSFASPDGVRGAGAEWRLPELELEGGCYYPVGRGLRLPPRRRMACADLELANAFTDAQMRAGTSGVEVGSGEAGRAGRGPCGERADTPQLPGHYPKATAK